MAISKKFTDLVQKVVGSNVGELLRQIGEQATKHAYSGNDASYAQYALDTLPDAWRNPRQKQTWSAGTELRQSYEAENRLAYASLQF